MDEKTNVADPMTGGTVRERALFWKGENPGDVIIGRVEDVRRVKFESGEAPAIVFGACATRVAGDETWHYQRAAQVVMSASLRSRVSETADFGKVFAIRFDGMEASDNAEKQDARLYTVVEHQRGKLSDILGIASA